MDISSSRWTTLRKFVQTLIFLLFLVWLILVGREVATAWWAPIPFQIDPLTWLSASVAGRTILGGWSFTLGAILVTLFFGRVWCGWLCPMGSLLDLFSLTRWRAQPKRSLDGLRSGKHLVLVAILVGVVAKNQTLLIFDPVTLIYRTFTLSIWPGLNHLVSFLQRELYPVKFFQIPIQEFDRILRPEILPESPMDIRLGGLFLGVVGGLILLNLIDSRFWCRYLCPLGGLLGWLSKAPVFRLQVKDSCLACAVCIDRCPTGAIQSSEPFIYDPAECTVCMECIDLCPETSVALGLGWQPRHLFSYDPTRRQLLSTFGLTVIGVGGFRLNRIINDPPLPPLRPPGVTEWEFLSSCLRCNLCIGVCPTGALQPALTESGVEGFWTPVFIPRSGYCDFSCFACGQACPSHAIPDLDLEKKQLVVIGKAHLDRDLCIAWAEEESCIVCEEMCPLPEKAIRLEVVDHIPGKQTPIELLRPLVDQDACIGCGVCEYKCPVEGEAAIRILPSEVDVEVLG